MGMIPLPRAVRVCRRGVLAVESALLRTSLPCVVRKRALSPSDHTRHLGLQNRGYNVNARTKGTRVCRSTYEPPNFWASQGPF